MIVIAHSSHSSHVGVTLLVIHGVGGISSGIVRSGSFRGSRE